MFTEKDFKNESGIQSCIFGPPLWFAMHCISFTYPVNPTELDKKHYMDFFLSLEYVLPCKFCRENFKNNIKMANFSIHVMKSRDTFSRFMHRFHNCVNTMLDKQNNPTFEEVREKFENFRSRCLPPTSSATAKESKKYTAKESIKESKRDAAKETAKEKPKEKGCVDSMYGIRAKTILTILPSTTKKENYKIDAKCKACKITNNGQPA